MHIEQFVEYCFQKAGVSDSFPFDENTLVLKVMGKMFALCNISKEPLSINLKCDPELAIRLREEHEEITPGYHMSKKHWNTVVVGEGLLEQSLIYRLIDDSYDLVVSGLTKKQKEELANLKSTEQ